MSDRGDAVVLGEEHMIEVAMIVGPNDEVLYEHAGASAGAIPDSEALWRAIWQHRDALVGIAHTHPWHGEAAPSHIDLTTFRAVERGLAAKLKWWVVTLDRVAQLERVDLPDGKHYYERTSTVDTMPWVPRLRELSRTFSVQTKEEATDG